MTTDLNIRILDQITIRMDAGADVRAATVAAAKAAVAEARAKGWTSEQATALGMRVTDIGAFLAAEMLTIIDEEGIS